MKAGHTILIGVLMLAAVVAGYSLQQIMRPEPTSVASVNPPAHPPAEDLIGRHRPDFELPDLNNRMHSISEWDGRSLLINFWATWCAPCREEIPAFIAVREQFQARGFEVIGIAIDRPDFVYEFVRELDIPYPMLYGEQTAMEIGRRYGNYRGGLPYSVFIDAAGKIRYIHDRGVLTVSELIPLVSALLENEPKMSQLP